MTTTPRALYEIFNAYLAGAQVWACLVGESYKHDPATYQYISDLGTHELTGGRYRRIPCGEIEVVQTTTGVDMRFKSPPTWYRLDGQVVGGAIVYIKGATDATSPILAWLDVANLTPSMQDLVFSSTNNTFLTITAT